MTERGGGGGSGCACVRGASACAWHVKLQGTADVSCDSICQLVNAARAGQGRPGA